MWRVGQDATLRMTVGALVVLDRPPTLEALAERLPSPSIMRHGCRRRGRRRPGGPPIDADVPPVDHHVPRRPPPPFASVAGPGRARCSISSAARVDPVRPRMVAVGRDADRRRGGRADALYLRFPPRAHRRDRGNPPARAAPRRAVMATCQDVGAPGAKRAAANRRATATASRGTLTITSTCRGRYAGVEQHQRRP